MPGPKRNQPQQHRSRRQKVKSIARGQNPLFDAADIGAFAEDFFAAAIRPAAVGHQFNQATMVRLREWASALAKRMLADVHDGSLTGQELVAVLAGAAVAVNECLVLDEVGALDET